jgi:hypothetical protein
MQALAKRRVARVVKRHVMGVWRAWADEERWRRDVAEPWAARRARKEAVRRAFEVWRHELARGARHRLAVARSEAAHKRWVDTGACVSCLGALYGCMRDLAQLSAQQHAAPTSRPPSWLLNCSASMAACLTSCRASPSLPCCRRLVSTAFYAWLGARQLSYQKALEEKVADLHRELTVAVAWSD